MTNIDALRNHFELREYQTAITRNDFEAHFKAAKEKVTFTFGGWDGKSYDGESRTARVYRTDIKGYEDVRFIKVGKGLHYIEEDRQVLEKRNRGNPSKRRMAGRCPEKHEVRES